MSEAGFISLLAFWTSGAGGVLGQLVPELPEGRPVASLYAEIMAVIDDPQQLRADEAVLLRMISQAQEWVALRYRLLIHSFQVPVVPGVPWMPLPATTPQLLMVTEVLDPTFIMLTPVPVTRLRYSDPQWLETTGMPTRWYRVGWTIVGFYPVPARSGLYVLTGVCMPPRMTQGSDILPLPMSYDDAVVRVAAGLLLLGRERKYAKGLELIRQGLGLPAPQEQAQPQPAGVA